MLAYRTTWMVKQGYMQKALEALEAEIERTQTAAQFRVYTPDISPNVLVHESVWESVEEHDRFWAEYNATPGSDAFYGKWNELVKRRVGTERWNVTRG